MTSLPKRVTVAIAAACAFATPARAQNEAFSFDNYCVMGAFQVCASVRLFSEGNVLRMQVWNMDDDLGSRHTITALGLYHAGNDYDWSGRIQNFSVWYNGSTNITSYWSKKGANQIGSLGGTRVEVAEGTQGNAGIIGCNDPGGNVKWATCGSFDAQPYVEFVFNLNSHFALSDVELRWHSQQVGPNAELSLKCDTGGAGDYPDCAPQTVVPEPATMTLMGTGLIGVIGAARRRRRKSKATLA